MRRYVPLIGGVAVAVASLGWGGSAPAAEAQATASLRVIHAATGAPAVEVLVDQQRVAGNLAFAQASEYTSVPSGPRTVRLASSAQPATPLVEAPLDLRAGQQATLVIAGPTTALRAVVLEDDNAPPPAGQAKIRFVHGAPAVPPVEVANRASGQVLADGLAFGVQGYVNVPAGAYTLDVRPDNTSANVLSLPNVTLSPGQIITFVAAGADVNNMTAIQVVYASAPAPARAPSTGIGPAADQTPAPWALAVILAALGTVAFAARRPRVAWMVERAEARLVGRRRA